MIEFIYGPEFHNLAAQARKLGNKKVLENAIRTVFAGIGSDMRIFMAREFSAFTGETKQAVSFRYTGFTPGVSGTFTLMEIGIPQGKLARDKAFFENVSRVQSYDKFIPIMDKDFRAWVVAHFPSECTTPKKTSQMVARVGHAIMQRKTASKGAGRHALEKTVKAFEPVIAEACSKFMDVLARKLTTEESGGVTF